MDSLEIVDRNGVTLVFSTSKSKEIKIFVQDEFRNNEIFVNVDKENSVKMSIWMYNQFRNLIKENQELHQKQP